MTRGRIRDEETKMLVTIAGGLEEACVGDRSDWEGSPFSWLLGLPSRQKGAVAEKLVAGWCASRGLAVSRSPDTQADRIIGGKRVEIKFSTLWTDPKKYVFQQIRDQDYEYLFFLGVSPSLAHAWIISKKEFPFDLVRQQHGGESGRDTWWVDVYPDKNEPEWLAPYGGTLTEALDRLSVFE